MVCESTIANVWLAQALAGKHDHDLLCNDKPEKLRRLFFVLLDHLGIPGPFSMYSFRRGGATARIYLQDAAATVSHLQLTDDQRSYMS